jgi:hypothetical protein
MKRGTILLLTLLSFVMAVHAQNGPQIRRITGQGNDGLVLDLAPGMHDSILSSPTSTYAYPVYDFNTGPVKIDVYDPSIVPQGNFTIYFTDTANALAKWVLIYHGAVNDTVFGDSILNAAYTQVIPQWGMSVWTGPLHNPGTAGAIDNGFLEATMTFSNGNHWLSALPDLDGYTPQNWIRSGTQIDTTGNPSVAYFDDHAFANGDTGEFYEDVLGGTWAPYKLLSCSDLTNGPAGAPGWKKSFIQNALLSHLASVDIVITSDTSKWTRCVVLETQDDWTLAQSSTSINKVNKLDLRRHPSVDKNGLTVLQGGLSDSINPASADYISGTGMGWFPGYAINVETGERLNMAFGENSWLANDNGADMIWNPTSTAWTSIGDPIFGGMHYIYVFGHNGNGAANFDIPAYDAGLALRTHIDNTVTAPSDGIKNEVFRDAMWVNIPLLAQGQQLLSSDVSIRLRVAKKYSTQLGSAAFPRYTFSTTNLSSVPSARLNGLGLYPNPAQDKLYIQNMQGASVAYTIMDLMGRPIVNGSLNPGQAIPVDQFQPGMYMIRVTDNNTVFTGNFIH